MMHDTVGAKPKAIAAGLAPELRELIGHRSGRARSITAIASPLPRGRDQIAQFVEGLGLIEPGVVQIPWWRPDGEEHADADQAWMYGSVARKRAAPALPAPHAGARLPLSAGTDPGGAAR
jgi:hypothetical protein